MPFEARFDPHLKVIVGRFQGRIVRNDCVNYAIAVSRLMAQHGCRLLLTDRRHATLAMSTTELYEIPSYVDRAGWPPGVRRAVVVSNDDPDERFFVNVSQNKGQILRAFRSVEQATAWLVSDAAVAS